MLQLNRSRLLIRLAGILKEVVRKVAVARGIFVQVVLMILLGGVEVTQRLKLHNNLPTHFALHCAIDLLYGCPITRVGIVDARAIARADVVTMLV